MRTIMISGSSEWNFGIHGERESLLWIVEEVFRRYVPGSGEARIATGARVIDNLIQDFAETRGYATIKWFAYAETPDDLFIGIWNGVEQSTPFAYRGRLKRGIPALLITPRIHVSLAREDEKESVRNRRL